MPEQKCNMTLTVPPRKEMLLPTVSYLLALIRSPTWSGSTVLWAWCQFGKDEGNGWERVMNRKSSSFAHTAPRHKNSTKFQAVAKSFISAGGKTVCLTFPPFSPTHPSPHRPGRDPGHRRIQSEQQAQQREWGKQHQQRKSHSGPPGRTGAGASAERGAVAGEPRRKQQAEQQQQQQQQAQQPTAVLHHNADDDNDDDDDDDEKAQQTQQAQPTQQAQQA